MAPRLLAAHAVTLSEVRLAFDRAITVPAGATASFAPLDIPAVTAAATSWSIDGAAAIVTIAPDLSPRARYAVTVAGVADLAGNHIAPADARATFAPAAPRAPASRRFELWSMLPQHARAGDDTGDLAHFIACLQDIVDVLLADADAWPMIFDLARAPEPFVDAILVDVGNPFALPDDLGAKRRLTASLVDIYRQKGTAFGIANALRLLFGLGSSAQPYAAEVLSLGDSELGADWLLGPGASWSRYAFDVNVSRVLTDTERRHVRALVEYMRPAHTHFVELIEPAPPMPSSWWVLGGGALGDDSQLAG